LEKRKYGIFGGIFLISEGSAYVIGLILGLSLGIFVGVIITNYKRDKQYKRYKDVTLFQYLIEER